jgi:hypothetical protein
MSDTLDKWGTLASQHIHLTDASVRLHIDSDEIHIPEPDKVRRKALWGDTWWIIARIMETAAETVSRNYERTDELLLAGERLVALCRGVMATNGYVARSITLARCIDAYDAAKRKFAAPSAYQRLRNPKALEEDPATEPPLEASTKDDQGWQKAPAIPEPETEALYQVYACWEKRLKIVDEELAVVRAAHAGGDPQAPCPEPLARAYTHFFKTKNTVEFIRAALGEQLGEHMATLCSDGSGDTPSEIRMRISYAVVKPEPGVPDEPTPADNNP